MKPIARLVLTTVLLASPAFADEFTDRMNAQSEAFEQHMHDVNAQQMNQLDAQQAQHRIQEQQREIDELRIKQQETQQELGRCRIVGGC